VALGGGRFRQELNLGDANFGHVCNHLNQATGPR
jgi:hypothetical protein